MKYAIQDTYWWFDTKEYKGVAWVQGIKTATFKERSKTPYAIRTKCLSEAKLYNTSTEATSVAKLLSTPACPAEVVEVSDKRLFEARLKGK